MFKVILGGTFEYLHSGHSRLIDEAFSLIKEKGNGIVEIGLASDVMAQSKSHAVSNYATRERELNLYIADLLVKMSLPSDCYFISQLDDPFGPSVSEDYDCIVVSPETRIGADKINQIRRKKGLKELQIAEVSFVLAEDTVPISSTRIHNGEIDKNGRLIKK
ncbi:MAG: pantetheine-phosphate adenylyltransferase [Methanimicrococcus sp.]|nr:pantetheine-phosphate adenylyltransferase [Methanimicrococcus sp.]